jgi:hypothetical protein
MDFVNIICSLLMQMRLMLMMLNVNSQLIIMEMTFFLKVFLI